MESFDLDCKDIEIQADLNLFARKSFYHKKNSELIKVHSASKTKIKSCRGNSKNHLLVEDRVKAIVKDSQSILVVNSILPSIKRIHFDIKNKKISPRRKIINYSKPSQRNHSYIRIHNYYLSEIH